MPKFHIRIPANAVVTVTGLGESETVDAVTQLKHAIEMADATLGHEIGDTDEDWRVEIAPDQEVIFRLNAAEVISDFEV